MKKNKIIIFDSTLRDWQQCPWAWMDFEKNLEYSKLANKLWIDILEAGFPSASELDFKIVNEIAKNYAEKKWSPKVAGLCQLRENQIDITIKSLEPLIKAKKAVLHTYLPVDPNLLEASLWWKFDEKFLINEVFRLIKKATNAGCEVEFSPEWYSRLWENFDFTTKVIISAIEAWAKTINCPDTIWWACKFEWENYFLENIKKHKKIIDEKFPKNEIIWSVHNHNDFGLAVENTINSVLDWPAKQVEVTINWVWERAWNASLEQVVMILNTFWKDLEIWIKTEYLQEISDFIWKNMLKKQVNFPITWENSAKHTSWWHTNAILKNPLVYQPFDPKKVWNKISFVFWPLSWGNHAKNVIENSWYKCEDFEKAEIAQFIKNFYKERRKWITDKELTEAYFEFKSPIQIKIFDYSKNSNSSTVILEWKFFDLEWKIERKKEWKDSALAGLKDLIDENFEKIKIQNYKSKSIWEWIDAKSFCEIIISMENWETFTWKWIDDDIEISAMKALINAVNWVFIEREFRI